MGKPSNVVSALHAALASFLFVVSFAHGAPQPTTTAIIIGENPYSEGVGVTVGSFEGALLGTGSDGTTYVLSRTSETMTIVEDSTHLSAHAAIITAAGSVTMVDDFQCSFDKSQDAIACTNSIVLADSATAFTTVEKESGRILELSVPITTSTAAGQGASSTSSSDAEKPQRSLAWLYSTAIVSISFLIRIL